MAFLPPVCPVPLSCSASPNIPKQASIINNEGNQSNMNAVLNTPQTQRITLYYREGSSDKMYEVIIEPQGAGFVVNFAYGRRGSTMNTGTKTQTPVDYDAAITDCGWRPQDHQRLHHGRRVRG